MMTSASALPTPPASPTPTPSGTTSAAPAGFDLDEQKKIAEISKLDAEKLKVYAGLVVGIASTIGLIAVFAYCFFVLRFFPSGLKVGDTLFFVFATLALTLIGPFLAAMGVLVYVPWIYRKKGNDATAWFIAFGVSAALVIFAIRSVTRDLVLEKGGALSGITILLLVLGVMAVGVIVCGTIKICGDKLEKGQSLSGVLVVVLVLGFGVVQIEQGIVAFTVVSGILLGGFIFVLGIEMLEGDEAATLEELRKKKRKQRFSLTFMVIGSLVPFVFCGMQSEMLTFVMKNMGVYTEKATIVANKNAFGKIQAAAAAQGIRLYSCQSDGENISVSNVRILWHGIGDRSYVEIEQEKKSARIELDSEGVRKSESKAESSCIELRRGIYFDSGKSSMTDKQLKVSTPIVQEFFKAKKENDDLVIIGYADSMPRPIEDNMLLARDRACAVYRQLQTLEFSRIKHFYIDLRGDMEGLDTCDAKLGVDRERACEARNRRVELRLTSPAVDTAGPGMADAKAVCL